MAVRILGAARHRILDIWDYTAIEWSEDQADSYVRGLVDAIHDVQGKRHLWRNIPNDDLGGVHFIRFRHHYIFFRELTDGHLGVISVLHENMDLPSRLKEDSK